MICLSGLGCLSSLARIAGDTLSLAIGDDVGTLCKPILHLEAEGVHRIRNMGRKPSHGLKPIVTNQSAGFTVFMAFHGLLSVRCFDVAIATRIFRVEHRGNPKLHKYNTASGAMPGQITRTRDVRG
jgi:hypothetical protein